jgi:hypothetical protein
MNKLISKITLALAISGSVAGFSQQKSIPCDTYNAMEQHFKTDPAARANYNAIQAEMLKAYQEHEKNKIAGKTTAAFEYTIPVVFHVLHQGGSENVSDATILAALDYVNKDFARANSDTGSTVQPFKSLFINSDIKLMLAKKDESGNCTNGIVRRWDARTNWDRTGGFGTIYNGITWNSAKYLNIILVKSIIASAGQVGTVVGYTFKPGTWSSGAVQDAVVYNANFLTGISIRSITHEVGHWLNLSHTWGNTNDPNVACGDDGVSDTPQTKGQFGGCASSSVNVCAQTFTYNNNIDNVQNIMNYSDCPRNFTSGQTTFMRTALASAISSRNNLWSNGNLGASGTDVNGLGICAPIAEFYSANASFSVCSGGSLTMKDFSYNGTITSYQWAADNGAVIVAPTASQTAINFPNIGITNVTLTINNPQGSSTKVRQVTAVNSTPQITGTHFESFESGATPTNWTVINPDNDAVMWTATAFGGADGLSSFYIDGPSNAANRLDILQSPILNLQANPGAVISYSVAYARQTSTTNDEFIVRASKDCGATWVEYFKYLAGQLSSGSGGLQSTPYVPSSTQWKKLFISNLGTQWNNFKNEPSVLFRFEFEQNAGGTSTGNRIFLDGFRIEGTVGLNELTKSIGLLLYPNPTNGEANLKFTLSTASKIEVNIVDVLGKQMLAGVNENFSTGEHTISLNKNNQLAKGIYFVNMSVNGAKMSQKLIIE